MQGALERRIEILERDRGSRVEKACYVSTMPPPRTLACNLTWWGARSVKKKASCFRYECTHRSKD